MIPFANRFKDIPQMQPCPSCARPVELDDLIDMLYPLDRKQSIWNMLCTESLGGCGYEVYGRTAEEAAGIWNALRLVPSKG